VWRFNSAYQIVAILFATKGGELCLRVQPFCSNLP
jgi:hypothetical protein